MSKDNIRSFKSDISPDSNIVELDKDKKRQFIKNQERIFKRLKKPNGDLDYDRMDFIDCGDFGACFHVMYLVDDDVEKRPTEFVIKFYFQIKEGISGKELIGNEILLEKKYHKNVAQVLYYDFEEKITRGELERRTKMLTEKSKKIKDLMDRKKEFFDNSDFGPGYIIMPFFRTSLSTYLESRKKITVKEFYNIFSSIVCGTEFYHDEKICHRDCHLGNIFVDECQENTFSRVWIGDPGMSLNFNDRPGNYKGCFLLKHDDEDIREIVSGKLQNRFEKSLYLEVGGYPRNLPPEIRKYYAGNELEKKMKKGEEWEIDYSKTDIYSIGKIGKKMLERNVDLNSSSKLVVRNLKYLIVEMTSKDMNHRIDFEEATRRLHKIYKPKSRPRITFFALWKILKKIRGILLFCFIVFIPVVLGYVFFCTDFVVNDLDLKVGANQIDDGSSFRSVSSNEEGEVRLTLTENNLDLGTQFLQIFSSCTQCRDVHITLLPNSEYVWNVPVTVPNDVDFVLHGDHENFIIGLSTRIIMNETSDYEYGKCKYRQPYRIQLSSKSSFKMEGIILEQMDDYTDPISQLRLTPASGKAGLISIVGSFVTVSLYNSIIRMTENILVNCGGGCTADLHFVHVELSNLGNREVHCCDSFHGWGVMGPRLTVSTNRYLYFVTPNLHLYEMDEPNILKVTNKWGGEIPLMNGIKSYWAGWDMCHDYSLS